MGCWKRGLVTGLLALLACGKEDPGPAGFLDVRVEQLASARAVVRFQTTQPATCKVEFGTVESNLDRTATDPNMVEGNLVTDHTVPLEDLTPDTAYFFRAVATTKAGETSRSGVATFRTLTGQVNTTLRNVALGSLGTTVSSVSSNYGGGGLDSAYGANHALDGQMSTEWATNGDGNGAWLELDLGQPRTLHELGFRSRKMSDGTSIITSVRVSLDGAAFQGPFATPDPDTTYRFVLGAPVTAQHVRLESVTTTGGNTGAREVELWGPSP